MTVTAIQVEPRTPRPRRRRRYWPAGLRIPPALNGRAGRIQPRSALLINPFYPKDPHASFGKHVLTPTLALTSIAGATPSDWEVAYWDENLLQGPPPWQPCKADGVWQYDGERFRRLDVSRGVERARGAPPALHGLAEYLRRRTGADAVAAVAFPVEP